VTFGAFYVSGLQQGTASYGQTQLGPFTIPFSECVNVTQYTWNETVQQSFATPAADNQEEPSPLGLWVIPTPSNSGTILAQFPTQTGGFYISPTVPTFFALDPNNLPQGIYLTSQAGNSVVLQWT
jgi:hypothetical protein